MQTAAVQAIIGPHGEKLTGPLVKQVKGLSSPTLMVEYRTTVSIGVADPQLDAAARDRAAQDDLKAANDHRASVAIAVARVLKKNLRNPASANWLAVKTNEHGTTVCVTLRAQNGFGGVNVEDYAVQSSGKMTQSPAVWIKSCTGSLYDYTAIVANMVS